jgi:hypothetical protein
LKYWLFGKPEESTLESEEYPPRHLRCRSGTGPRFAFEDGAVGVNGNENYDEWMRRQDEATQIRLLGVAYATYAKEKGRIDAYRPDERDTLNLSQLDTAFSKIVDKE